jgi:hypothetical protein
MKFKLTKKQLNYALGLAMQRHDAKHTSFRNKDTDRFMNKSKGSLSDKFSVDRQYMAHFLGVIGELGYSLVTGESVDENIYSVRDDGQDFEGVEVKTITYMGNGEPELKITVKEYDQRKPPKLYVLTRFDLKNNEIEVLGKITRMNFEKKKVRKRYGARLPQNYIVPLSKMDKV